MIQSEKWQASHLADIFLKRWNESWKNIDHKDLFDFLSAKIDQAITIEELKKILSSKKKLSIKMGIDPTGPDVHLGHLLPIMLLRQFQKAGHTINLIIGDFTAMIGDPSGRDTTRPALTGADVKKNMATYLKQLQSYVAINKAKVHHNASWLSAYTFEKILKDLQQLSLTEILQREDFRKRLDAGHGISMAELLYSYAQGIDSAHIKPDIEVGGRDQLLNFAHARTIMKLYKQTPEVALTTPVLEGTAGDGRKMSKSYGNYIPLNASASEKFGKVMSIPDALIASYFIAFADIKASEISTLKTIIEKDPFETKKQLGQFIVAMETGSLDAGIQERKAFEATFSKKEFVDQKLTQYTATQHETCLDVVQVLMSNVSKSEIKRLFANQAVRIIEPHEQILAPSDIIPKNSVLKIGKKHFFKIQ